MKTKLFFAHVLGMLAASGSLERQDWLIPKSTRKPTPEEKQAEIDRMDAAATKRARKAEKCRAIQQRLEDRKKRSKRTASILTALRL